MTIYSLYIYDRTKRPRPAVEGNILPGVSRAVTPRPHDTNGQTITFLSPRDYLNVSSGVVVAATPVTPPPPPPLVPPKTTETPPPSTVPSGLPFDEEAKLVYGVILSLRHMIKKLSGREEHFVAYKTSTYKLHLFETMSGYKFVMLTDPQVDSMRYVLRQIYTGPFLEYVVRNPLFQMDSKEYGIDNEHFRGGVDRLLRGQSVFA
ncbi:hypothetical protein Clacol_000414 [Clathrus columnatus]|uniref:Trafficking protein particle complex subunit n=1 Tax=Clathrus columnatus TaxID=1419009 RepID=A0AAV4ZWJ7_9AGAM|nr:hypothetical protein Clacol_000414 [Clathrus columnatus]